MAHYLRQPLPWSPERTVEVKVERPVIEPDGDWEAAHMSWLGYGDSLGIALGCQECAEAIYEILEACRLDSGDGVKA